MRDDWTLGEHNIEAMEFLNLVLQRNGVPYIPQENQSEYEDVPFPIYLKTLMGKVITFKVNATDTIRTLKEMVEEIEGEFFCM